MAKESFSELMTLAELLAAGIRKNMDQLANRGVSEGWIANLENKILELKKKNEHQETLKGELKEATAEVDSGLDELRGIVGEGKKMVKLGIAREGWKKFGMADAR